jgi:hypothetical protein
MLPGGVELAENVSHLVLHGDFAHDGTAPGHTPFNEEHGCGGGFHLCSCCHSQSPNSSAAFQVASPGFSFKAAPADRPSSAGAGFPQSLKNPPRA